MQLNTSFPCVLLAGLLEEEEIENGLGLQPVPLRHPICKPCITLSKERSLDLSESKTRAPKKNVIVRSSYFLKNTKKEDIQDDKSEINEAANDKSHSSIRENDYDSMSDARNGAVIAAVKNANPRSSYFQHKPSARNGQYINGSSFLSRMMLPLTIN